MTHRDAETAPSLWRHADFLKLWTGQTVSELGSVVTRTAVPLVALLVLGAGPTEMALLVVAGSLAILLVGFFAGALGRPAPAQAAPDRHGRASRSLLLLSIPIAYAAGALRMEQLYLVTFLEGCLGALFDAAYPAYVPSLIGVDRVVDGNSKLATSSSLAEIGGPGLAGALVQLVSAPLRDPGRCAVVRRVGGVAAPHPDAGTTAAGEDDDDGDPAGDRRRPSARPAPSGAPSDRDAVESPTSPGRSTASSTRSTSSTTCT